jgi:TM2 domain-containing membrane protein YozV
MVELDVVLLRPLALSPRCLHGVRSMSYDPSPAPYPRNTHFVVIGYILWIFGFFGAHRFYYGRQISGVIWFFTLGLLFIGWLIDLFLIPGMDREADLRYYPGPIDYTVAWILLTFLGPLGIHRFYMGKWGTGLIWLLTGGLIMFGVLYDYLTLNEQVSEKNAHSASW